MKDFIYKIKVPDHTPEKKHEWFKWCGENIGNFAWNIDGMVFVKKQDAIRFKEHFGIEE